MRLFKNLLKSVIIGWFNKMGRRTSIEKRKLIIKHFQSGKTQKQIAEIVDLSPSTVQYIIQSFVRENRVHNKGRKAPNKIFNENDERWILRKIKEDPMLSAPAVAKDVEMFLGKNVIQKLNAEYLEMLIFMGEQQETSRLLRKIKKSAYSSQKTMKTKTFLSGTQ